MKKTLLSIGLILICAILLAGVSVNAESSIGIGESGYFKLQYDTADKTATVTGLTFKNTDDHVSELIIPSTVDIDGETYSVTAIGKLAFALYGFDKIVVEEGITTLAGSAFESVSTPEIELPSTLTNIGGGAFQKNYVLQKVTFKSDITALPYSCFYGCRALRSFDDIVVPGKITSIGAACFCECYALKYVDLEGVTAIDSNAFKDCWALEEIVIPDTVEKIGSLFNNCLSLKKATIGAKSVGEFTFFKCPELTKVVFTDGNETVESAFNQCPKLVTILFGGGLKKISGTFYQCPAIRYINFPDNGFIATSNVVKGTAYEETHRSADSILYLGRNIVDGADAGGDLLIREGTVNIADEAFLNNTKISSVTLPDSIRSIGKSSFDGCTSLENIDFTYAGSLTDIGRLAFRNCAVKSLVFPESLKNIEFGSFQDCPDLVSVKATAALDYVGAGAFAGCKSLTEIDLVPGNTVFNGFPCNNTPFADDPANTDGGTYFYISNMLVARRKLQLNRYDVRPGTVSINYGAFAWGYGDWNTGSSKDMSFYVYVPEGVKYIGANAFYNAGLAKSYILPKSIEYIGKNAFDGISDKFDGYYLSSTPLQPAGEGGVQYDYHYEPPKDIYYLGTESDWEKIENHAEIPNGTTLHFADELTDVADGQWFAPGARYCTSRGIMVGTSGGIFTPDLKMTRAMFVTVLAALDNADLSAYNTVSFSDVVPGSWYANAVEWAAVNGYTSGTGGWEFSPNAYVTRQELAQFLYTYAKAKGKDVSASAELSAFTDAGRIADWATAAFRWAVGSGMIAGSSPTTLSPEGVATRAQSAMIFMRFAQNVID